ncbi:hypothetical protein J6595_14250 [Jiella sp. KSK16Y-1]|uniref:Uncharacterized protein n=2 Tax=Jiella mangrovi TaxID=2821407 RepID=A0ABS4BJM3_9HYPH|nr:hypothetical protein [Jiella mangrovi]
MEIFSRSSSPGRAKHPPSFGVAAPLVEGECFDTALKRPYASSGEPFATAACGGTFASPRTDRMDVWPDRAIFAFKDRPAANDGIGLKPDLPDDASRPYCSAPEPALSARINGEAW